MEEITGLLFYVYQSKQAQTNKNNDPGFAAQVSKFQHSEGRRQEKSPRVHGWLAWATVRPEKKELGKTIYTWFLLHDRNQQAEAVSSAQPQRGVIAANVPPPGSPAEAGFC